VAKSTRAFGTEVVGDDFLQNKKVIGDDEEETLPCRKYPAAGGVVVVRSHAVDDAGAVPSSTMVSSSLAGRGGWNLALPPETGCHGASSDPFVDLWSRNERRPPDARHPASLMTDSDSDMSS
jgi:hypothetical protein